MHNFKQTAISLLERRDFPALERHLFDCPEEHRKFADEVSLLSLVEQKAPNEKLERPLDNYISKYSGEVPISNIVTAARLKYELGKLEEAVDLLIDNNVPRENTEATEICVLALFNLKRFQEGKELVNYLLAFAPNQPGYHEWNILFSYKLAKPTEVLESWASFTKLNGEFTQRIDVLSFVVRSYVSTGRIDDAQAVYDEYNLENELDDIHAAIFIADFEKAKGNLGKCETILKRVKEKHPEIPEIQWNLALCQLVSGNLVEGWENYEARWSWIDFSSPKRIFDAPRWDGNAGLNGKKILIWGEQGIGDQLRFLTLLPRLLSSHPDVDLTLEVDHRLIKLVRSWYPEVREIWPMGLNDTSGISEYSQFDYQIPSGSLPRLYFTHADSFETQERRFLKVSQTKKAALFGGFLEKYPRLVGVSWRSMMLTPDRIGDYVNVNGFKTLIDQAPRETGFVILQYAITDEEKQSLSMYPNVFIPDEDFLNEVDLNAVYAGACDLLISCGTVVATMAGIFGIPVISWCKFDDPVNLGQKYNPWFPNRLDIRVQPNWDRVVLVNMLSKTLNNYLNRIERKNFGVTGTM